jgi:hypothetical protein
MDVKVRDHHVEAVVWKWKLSSVTLFQLDRVVHTFDLFDVLALR